MSWALIEGRKLRFIPTSVDYWRKFSKKFSTKNEKFYAFRHFVFCTFSSFWFHVFFIVSVFFSLEFIYQIPVIPNLTNFCILEPKNKRLQRLHKYMEIFENWLAQNCFFQDFPKKLCTRNTVQHCPVSTVHHSIEVGHIVSNSYSYK